MLKVILNHWQNQRHRPQSTLPILTPSDEETVTKVNPIFDDDREESEASLPSDTPSSTEEPEPETSPKKESSPVAQSVTNKALNRPRVEFTTNGFDSLDSRDDPVGAFVTDVVAEVHRPDTTSLPRTLAPNKEDDEGAIADNANAINDSDPTEYFNQARRTSGQASFLHNSYHHLKELSVLRRKDKEPRTSIFNFTNKLSSQNEVVNKDASAALESVTLTDKEDGAKKEDTPVTTHDKVKPSTSSDIPENTYSEPLPKINNTDTQLPSTSQNTQNSEEPLRDNNGSQETAANVPPPPPLPPLPSKVDKSTYTSTPITSSVLTEKAANLGNDVKKPEPLSHAEILKQAMMSHNNNLKPSEIAKREKESRAAAARERGDILPNKTGNVQTKVEGSPPNKTTNVQTKVESTPPKIVPKANPATNFKKPPQMTFPKPPPVEDVQETPGRNSRLNTGDDSPPPDEEISVSAAKPKPNDNTEVKKPIETEVKRQNTETEVKRPLETEIKKPMETEIKRNVESEVKTVRTNSITRAENSHSVEARRDSRQKTVPKNMPCNKCDRLHDPSEPCPTTAGPKTKKGVTRGDQIGSDEGNGSSGNTSGGSSSLPGPSKHRSEGDGGSREKRPKSPHICPHCFMYGRRSMRHKRPPELSKYDDYYLNAIHGSRSYRFSADSLSDFSTDPYDRHFHPWVGRKYRRKNERPFSRQRGSGGFRSPPEGSTLGTDEFDEDYLDKFPGQRRRRFSWGSCSCDQCSEASSFIFERRPKSFGEADEDKMRSMRGKGKWHPSGCTCGHTAHNGRRVKFEEKSNGTAKPTPEDKEGAPTTSTAKEGEDPSEITKDDDSKVEEKEGEEKKHVEKEGTKKNGQLKGILNGYPQYPWEIEDWELYMQKRYIVRRRRRALYMGIFALVFIVIIGMAVGLVMVWLRRSAPSQ